MTMTPASSFFTTTDGIWFTPTEHCRGPWNEHHCHAGPPTGLMARAVQKVLPQQRLTRITVNLLRPIPHAGFGVTAEITRQGRSVSQSSSSISDSSGKLCATAQGLHMSCQSGGDWPSYQCSPAVLEEARPGPFPIKQPLHDKPTFLNGVKTRYAPDYDGSPGPNIAWLKTVPLLADEQASAFERLCPLADCGNAFSRNAEPEAVSFINPDLTILLHRDPNGEWLGMQAHGYWENNGIGMSDALLFDQQGVVGRALQTLLLRPAESQV